MRALAILILGSSACGRGGFDRVPPPEPDAAFDATPEPDAPPPVLACTGPRFSIDAAMGMQLSATATARGYDVFTVDPDGQLRGYVYSFAGADLAAGVHDVSIAPNATGPLAPLAIGDDVLMLMPYGRPDTAGTALVALDARLGTKSTAMTEGLDSVGGALARNASGAIALITQRLDSAANPKQVEARLISQDGANVVGPYAVVDRSEMAYSQMILPAKDGFLVSWDANSHVRAELLDQRLVITTTEPVSISPQAAGANWPRAAYLASADRYLFVWYEKINNVDRIWGSLRDANLVELGGAPLLISGTAAGLFPVVVAGSDDFLVVWQDGPKDSEYHLGAARVTKDGDVVQPGIRSNGGAAVAWDLVVRYGQAALVWIETAGTAFNLRLDPVCNQ